MEIVQINSELAALASQLSAAMAAVPYGAGAVAAIQAKIAAAKLRLTQKST